MPVPARVAGHNTNIFEIREPTTYLEAKNNPEWIKTIGEEITALELNKTWEICELPKGRKPIRCKWLSKIKLKSDSAIDRFKARLVAKGYNQIEGINFHDRFSPVVKVLLLCKSSNS